MLIWQPMVGPGFLRRGHKAIFGKLFKTKLHENKKVLLRERKRHTARRVVSTPSVVLTGYPPPGGVPGPDRVPPRGGYPDLDLTGYPPGGYPVRYPPPGGVPGPGPDRVSPPGGGYLDLTGYPPGGGYPDPPRCLMAFWEMLQSIMGYGYPPPQVWTDKQSETITFPSYYVRGR